METYIWRSHDHLWSKYATILDCRSLLPCRRTWARSSQLLTSFGTKALVDLDSVHVVTYGVFFGLIIFCDISGVYAISSEKVFFIGLFL